ncbi:MAG TPA: hypothetical protein VEK57_26695 [Thermoanaerobaculia bacterium]|nr:hypothetical protein [Thermoanaerobaculia bacterium]
MTVPFSVIVLNEATNEQINAVHEALKQHTKGWWHHFDNTWIVGGQLTAGEWLDVVTPLIPEGRASVLVVQLPAEVQQRQSWAYYGIEGPKRSMWLAQNLGESARVRANVP